VVMRSVEQEWPNWPNARFGRKIRLTLRAGTSSVVR
jgi:hypothetical protein